jgi:hypothetical protein
MNTHKIDALFEIYFSCMGSEHYFTQMMKAFITPSMEGYGREYVCCVLASAFNKEDEKYFGETGVKLCVDEPAVAKDEEIIISDKEFLKRLEVEYMKFITIYPERKQEVSKYFQKLNESLSEK